MEKVYSVEDIVGNLQRMGSMTGTMSGFMPRSDSEAAFQVFKAFRTPPGWPFSLAGASAGQFTCSCCPVSLSQWQAADALWSVQAVAPQFSLRKTARNACTPV